MVFRRPERRLPHSVTLSTGPSSGRNRPLPRKPETKTCPRPPVKRKFVARSGIGYSALPGSLAGGVIDDLLSSTASDHDTLLDSFEVQRTCACRIDGNAIGDSKSIVL